MAPLIFGVWGWQKLNEARAIEAQKHLKEQEQLYLRTVESLALAVDAKDSTTYGHIRRVRAYAMGLARLCDITDSRELLAVETGSLLHDIGKLAVDDYILNKPGPLTPKEYEKIKLHAPAGDEILRRVEFPFPVADYVRHHHERWNGSGYPDGLKEDSIPLGARILAVADAFDAIHAGRPYKDATNFEEAVQTLRSHAGTLYDPRLVDLFATHFRELQAEAEAAERKGEDLTFRKYYESADAETAAFKNPDLDAEMLDHSDQMLRFAEFCQGIAPHMEWADAAAALSRRIRTLIPYDTCLILADLGNHFLAPIHAAGHGAEALQTVRIGLGKGISGWCAAYKRPMIHARPALELPSGNPELAEYGDSLVVPLDGLLGAAGTLSLYAKSPNTYTWQDLETLRLLVQLATPMVERAIPENRLEQDQSPGGLRKQADRVAFAAGTRALQLAEKAGTQALAVYIKLDCRAVRVGLSGPQVIEDVIGAASAALQSELRASDLLMRYGLDGLILVLPGFKSEQVHRQVRQFHSILDAVLPAEIRKSMSHTPWSFAQAVYPEEGSNLLQLVLALSRRMSPGAAQVEKEAPGSANVIRFLPRSPA